MWWPHHSKPFAHAYHLAATSAPIAHHPTNGVHPEKRASVMLFPKSRCLNTSSIENTKAHSGQASGLTLRPRPGCATISVIVRTASRGAALSPLRSGIRKAQVRLNGGRMPPALELSNLANAPSRDSPLSAQDRTNRQLRTTRIARPRAHPSNADDGLQSSNETAHRRTASSSSCPQSCPRMLPARAAISGASSTTPRQCSYRE